MVVETAACTSFFFPEGKVLSAGSLKFGRGVQYKASFVYMSTSLLRGSQMHACRYASSIRQGDVYAVVEIILHTADRRRKCQHGYY
jgi:hypothetical protein